MWAIQVRYPHDKLKYWFRSNDGYNTNVSVSSSATHFETRELARAKITELKPTLLQHGSTAILKPVKLVD